MPKNHLAIIIPGLGDDSNSSTKRIEYAVKHWEKYKITPLVHKVSWRDGNHLEPKLSVLLKRIDSLGKNHFISLVGTSAGASMAFNAYLERKDVVQKIVNVCGRLRTGDHKIRSLENMAKTSLAFKQSVQAFEKREKELTDQDKKKILTIRPFFGDELVPADTVSVEGAVNKVVYLPSHVLGIGYALRFSREIPNFITR